MKNMILKLTERVDRMEKTVDIRIGKSPLRHTFLVNIFFKMF